MKLKAHITITTGLLFLCLLPLFLVLINGVRKAALSYRMKAAADSSIESIFAGYDRELFDRYGLLLLNQSEDEICHELEDFMTYYGDPYKGLINARGGNFLPMSEFQAELQEASSVVDDGGVIFLDAAVNALGYSIAAAELEQLQQWAIWMDKGITASDEINQEAKAAEEMLQTLEQKAEWISADLDPGVLDLLAEKLGGFSWNLVKPPGSILSGKIIRRDGLYSNQASLPLEEPIDLLKETAFLFYIQKYFSSYTNKKENYMDKNCLEYEQEYLISGYLTDTENMNAVTGKLLVIREGLNILKLLQDQEKVKAAELAGQAAAVIFLTPGLETPVKYLIIGVWAYRDAVKDVSSLLSGDKVSWIGTGTGNEQEGILMDYEQYLLMLLFLENRYEKRYRVMDLIQLNLCAVQPYFQLDQCLYGIQVSISARSYDGMEMQYVKKRNYN